jgi:DNA helicase HerA-like ATPase
VTALDDFINPRIPPTPGQPIHLASNDMLTTMPSPRRKGESGGAHIGSLLTRRSDEVPIVLAVREVVSTHLAVLASTGSGKSYLAGVLLEELLMPHNRAARPDHRSTRRIWHPAGDPSAPGVPGRRLPSGVSDSSPRTRSRFGCRA